jgi:hypothetical protein
MKLLLASLNKNKLLFKYWYNELKQISFISYINKNKINKILLDTLGISSL